MTEDSERDTMTVVKAVDRLEAVVARYDVGEGPVSQQLLSALEDIASRLWQDAYDEGYGDAKAGLRRR